MFITLTYKNLPLNCYEVHICHFYQNKCFALEVVSDSTHLSYFNKYIDRVWDYKVLFSPSTRPNNWWQRYDSNVPTEFKTVSFNDYSKVINNIEPNIRFQETNDQLSIR